MRQDCFCLKIFKVLKAFYNLLIMAVLSFMIATVLFNVFSRYVLNNSIGWIDESSRFLFIWLIFLGAVLAYASNEHIGLDFFIELIPEKYRKFVVLVANLLVLFALVIMVQYGWQVALRARNISPGIGIRMTYVYIIMPISSLLMGLITVKRIVDQLRVLFSAPKLTEEKRVDM